MNKRHGSFFSLRPLIGLLIVAAGVVLLLEKMKVIEDVHILEYWPVILIMIGLGRMIQSQGYGYHRFFWGIVITAVGTLFLLNNLHYLHFGFEELWPILIIVIGIELIWGGLFRHRLMAEWKAKYAEGKEHFGPGCCSRKFGPDTEDSDFIDITAILGGGEYTFSNKALKGGTVSTIMGGCKIDLRNAEMEGDSMILETSSIMGGIEVWVPTHWQVVMQGTPVLGGMDNKTVSPENATKRLFIRGSSIMGGVEIKN